MDHLPIQYRDFWDVPRVFLTHVEGKNYLFDCPFDDSLEDYPTHYHVYEMPALSKLQLKGSWLNLRNLAIAEIGTVPVQSVHFDPTRRQSIDLAIFNELLGQTASHSK